MTRKSTHSPTDMRRAGPGKEPLERMAPRLPAPTASTEPQVSSIVKGIHPEFALQISAAALGARMLVFALVIGAARAAEASEKTERALASFEPAILQLLVTR